MRLTSVLALLLALPAYASAQAPSKPLQLNFTGCGSPETPSSDTRVDSMIFRMALPPRRTSVPQPDAGVTQCRCPWGMNVDTAGLS
jgi:hypothetical protein